MQMYENCFCVFIIVCAFKVNCYSIQLQCIYDIYKLIIFLVLYFVLYVKPVADFVLGELK